MTDHERRPTAGDRPDLVIVSGSSQVRTPAALNHAVYAARHGLRYVFDSTPAAVRSIYLHKVEVMRRHLATADWLFWVDDDAFFTNLDVDLRTFLAPEPQAELIFCTSPVNPEGGWTWMSSGQLFLRNTPRMAALLEAALGTDLSTVREWWDADALGLFTRGDQDAFVYQLRRDDSPWAGVWEARPWEAFNSRPYHYASRLDEHFLCHFAVPGGKSKMELIEAFAARMGTTNALLPEAEIAAYRTFIGRSDLAPFLGAAAGAPAKPASPGSKIPPTAPVGPLRRTARALRRRLSG